MPQDAELDRLAAALGERLLAAGLRLVTAESCTGGWLGKVITDIPGSSAWYERGFITYTNEAKQEMLGVAAATLELHGAVSEETVREMTNGALRHSRAQLAVSISGIAGPGGATVFKPVGMVCLAWNLDGRLSSVTEHFSGDREQIRSLAVQRALRGLLDVCA